jgi:hypothetical protein
MYLLRSGLGIPDYWHPSLEIRLDFLTGKIGRYPISKDIKAHYPGMLGEEKVPVTFAGGNAYASAVDIVLYGLGSHDMFIATKEKQYRRQVMHVVRWLEKHSTSLGSGIGWASAIDLPAFGLRAPWYSSIVQGFVLSFYVRLWQTDRSEYWIDLARQVWLGYHAHTEDGGFCRVVAPDRVIYEEYPGPKLDCVFNGMCYALIGLWEAWRSGLVIEAEQDFKKGLKGLSFYLPRFDFHRWSLYSLNDCLGKPFLASPYYHRANGLLGQVIGLMGDNSEFCAYGKRWLESSHSIAKRLWMSLRIGVVPVTFESSKAALSCT